MGVVNWSVVAIALLASAHIVKCSPKESRHGMDMAVKDWWEKTIFYQIYPRSFKDSDGDGVGDLKGIISKLDHLKDAGIGATWLSPIFKSPMKDFGYDISDFYSIQKEYGTMDDFKALTAKTKELGIKLILDFVPNHSSDQCEWFIKSQNASSEYADWYIWEDGKKDATGNDIGPPNNWVSVFRKSAWTYNEKRKQYYLHQFALQQPDLNYRNPEVVEEMKNVLRFWLENGAAGFRVDAINHLFEVDKKDFEGKFPDEPLSGNPGQGKDDYGYVDHIYTKDLVETQWMVYEWRKVLDEFTVKDNLTRVMMTEAYTDLKNTMGYYGNGTSEGSHMPFNFGLIADLNDKSTAKDFKFITDRWLTYMPMGKTANWVIGNHDQWRVGTRYGVDRIDGMNMMVLLLPGAGVTYNGEEIGMVNTEISWTDTLDPQACNTDDPINYWKSSRDPARTPFQWNAKKNAGFTDGDKTWLPINKNYLENNLEAQKATNRSHFRIYQNCATLRDFHTFSHGKLESVAFNDGVFAFVRTLAEHDSYVIVINLVDQKDEIDLNYFSNIAEELTVVERSINSNKNINDKIPSKTLKLDAFESVVLKSPYNGAAQLASGFLLMIACLLVKFI